MTATHDPLTQTWSGRGDLAELARAIVSLLGRDDDPPPRWSSPGFVRIVAATRTQLSMVLSTDELALAWPRLGALVPAGISSRGRAAEVLAHDPDATAF